MKLTQNTIKLLSELRSIESAEDKSLVVDDSASLRKNLLAVYRRTDNPDSQALIIQIMTEASGYPRSSSSVGRSDDISRRKATKYVNVDPAFVMSEDEFLELLPANGFFH